MLATSPEELSSGRAESSASTSGECMSRLRVTSDAISPAETRKPQSRHRRLQQRLEALTDSQLRLRHTMKKAFKRSNVHSCHKPILEQKGQLSHSVLQWVQSNLANCSADQGMRKGPDSTSQEGYKHRESTFPEGYESLYRMDSMPSCPKSSLLDHQRSLSGDLCVPVMPFQVADIPQVVGLHSSSNITREDISTPFPMWTPPALLTPMRNTTLPLMHKGAPRRPPPPSPFLHTSTRHTPTGPCRPIASAGELLQRLSQNNFKNLPEQPSSQVLRDSTWPHPVYQNFSWEQAVASAQVASGHLLNAAAALPFSCVAPLDFNRQAMPYLASGTTRAAGRPPADFGGLTALQTPFAESGPEQVHDTSSSPRSLLWEKHANSEAAPAGCQPLLMAHFHTVPSVGVPRGLQPFYQQH